MQTVSLQASSFDHPFERPAEHPHTQNGTREHPGNNIRRSNRSTERLEPAPAAASPPAAAPPAATAAAAAVSGSPDASQRTQAHHARASSAGSSRQGSRANANHLLNFQYQQPSRGGAGRGGGPHGRGGPANRRRGTQARPQKYDRNKFLQANYRFVVSDGVDDRLFHADADRMFDWEDVLQVELLAGGPVQCPISLDSPPTCPQITPCGHIYSFHAIMQHLVHHGGPQLQRWAPCPLCFEPVVARDLRLVLITPVNQPQVGGSMTFQLLKRGHTTIIPQPAGQPSSLGPPSDGAAGVAAGARARRGGPQHAGPAAALSPPAGPADGASTPSTETRAAGGAGASSTSSSGTPADAAAAGGDAAAPAPAPAATAAQPAAQARPEDQLVHPLAVNRWSKFAVVSYQEALPLLQEVGKQLAQYATELVSEGTSDAAMTAPYVYMAMDALAARAERWSEHRDELLAERAERAAPRAGAGTFPTAASSQQLHAPSATAVPPAAAAGAPSVSSRSPGVLAVTPANGSNTEYVGAPSASRSAAAAGASGPAEADSAPSTAAAAPAATATLVDSTAPDAGAAAAEAMPPGTEAAAAETMQDTAGDGGGGVGTAATGVPSQAMDIPQAASRDTGLMQPSAAAAAAAPAGSEVVLGSSPHSQALSAVNYSTTCGDFYMYQAVDGQWVFLDPLCVRCLLAHYGSYDACPATITAPLLELDRLEQTESSRKRWRFLSHLPLTGSWQFAEVDLTGLLPPAALAPFADEIAAREKRRQRQRREVKRSAASEAAAARAAAAARRGPSAKELAAMPSLARSPSDISAAAAAALAAGPQPTLADAEALAAARALGFASTEELSDSVALQAALDARSSPPSAPEHGVSFARIAKMGFAATGPALLGTSPPSGAASGSGAGPAAGSSSTGPAAAPPPPQPQGAWAQKPQKPLGAVPLKPSASSSSASTSASQGVLPPGMAAGTLQASTARMQTVLGFTLPTPSVPSSSGASSSTAAQRSSAAASPSVARSGLSGSWAASAASGPTAAPAPAGPAAPAPTAAKKGAKKGTLLFTSGAARRY